MNNYKNGDIVCGKVTGIENYGIFLSLNDSVTGLIHISEISESYVRNVADYANLGETIRAVVIGNDSDDHLKLSIKNFDYRIQKCNRNKIRETQTGFSTLKSLLDSWIDLKYDEIMKK